MPTQDQLQKERIRVKYRKNLFSVVRNTVFTLVTVAAVAVCGHADSRPVESKLSQCGCQHVHAWLNA